MVLEPEPPTTRTVLESLARDSIADSPLASFPPPERLAVHRGRATLEMAGTTYSGVAEFLIPASAQAIAAFYTEGPLIDQDFGGRLIIEGDSEFGPFRFDCPHCFVRPQAKTESLGRWALISPVNGPARIRYGGLGSVVTKALVLINNFDYRYGDPLESDRGWTRIGRNERVDHRSCERQGINREPGQHYGPSAPHVLAREGTHDKLNDAMAVGDHERAVRDLEKEIAELEAARESVVRDGLPEERTPNRADSQYSSGRDHSDDHSWGR